MKIIAISILLGSLIISGGLVYGDRFEIIQMERTTADHLVIIQQDKSTGDIKLCRILMADNRSDPGYPFTALFKDSLSCLTPEENHVKNGK